MLRLLNKARKLDSKETLRILKSYPSPRTPDDLVFLEHELITEIDCHTHAPMFFGDNPDTGKLGKWKLPNFRTDSLS